MNEEIKERQERIEIYRDQVEILHKLIRAERKQIEYLEDMELKEVQDEH